MSNFSFSTHPYLLGFDALEQMLESSAKTNNDSYPPYNIEQLSDDHFRITLAVAGFNIADLSVVVEGPQLIISGEQTQNVSEFLHQGIAARKFKRVFFLADCIETTGSQLENGLLNVDLRRISVNQAIQQIKIN
jgi:HSP20 family molecular chaperone IbpA